MPSTSFIPALALSAGLFAFLSWPRNGRTQERMMWRGVVVVGLAGVTAAASHTVPRAISLVRSLPHGPSPWPESSASDIVLAAMGNTAMLVLLASFWSFFLPYIVAGAVSACFRDPPDLRIESAEN